MLTTIDESKILFEWDLQNIDKSQEMICSPEFSFQGYQLFIKLRKNHGETNHGCYLKSVEKVDNPLKLHSRIDLVKRIDNTVTGSNQLSRDMRRLNEGWGKGNWIDTSTIQDHILKVKMWTSAYDFEYDFIDIKNTRPSFKPKSFLCGEYKLRIVLKKNEEGTMYNCFFKDVDSAISDKVYFQVDLFKRSDNTRVKSGKCEFTFNSEAEQGIMNWVDVESIRDYIIKVKVSTFKPFSDFVEKPDIFESVGILLFKKTSSNLSFLVGDEVVFIIQDVLTSRSDYFRAMLEGSFKESMVPMIEAILAIIIYII
jgi:hypothetical protein